MKTPSRRYWWKPPSQRLERDELIREKFALGWSLQDLAKEYDLTPQRIWQIVNYYRKEVPKQT